jgi:hypothetical protein
MPGNSRRELATTWEHYWFTPDGSYGTPPESSGACINVFLIVYFILQLCFRLPEEGNHQAHTLEVFNATAQKVGRRKLPFPR